MARATNLFALLDSDDPGDTRLADLDGKKQQQHASLTEELFGRAYPSARKVIQNRQKQQNGAPAYAKDGVAGGGARTDKKKGAQGGATQQGGRANGAAANDDAPAPPRLNDLAQFPSLK